MSLDVDPRFTFDAFVVGPANRLAAAAARRVAEAPGATYNPLFLYSGSGLGKTHLLGAIGQHAERVHSLSAVYETTERLMEAIGAAVEAGEPDVFRGRLDDVDVLLLDDVQFLAGQRQVQEELLRAWDVLAGRGAQVVLSSDRPPQEIDGLDERLLTRLSGGLIVDMGAPDFETRIAIARRKAGERGIDLSRDLIRALARIAFTNVRELQGALNRVIAVQELEGRSVTPDDVPRLLGTAADRGRDEFGEFLSDISGTVSAVVAEAEQRIADAILTWEGEGYRTRRLEGALAGRTDVAQAEELVERFEADVARLEEIRREIRELEPGARELESETLRDPDRVAEAQTLLRRVRERLRAPPAPPEGPTLDSVDDGSGLAVQAARAVAERPGAAYNPLYVLGPAGADRSALLAALGNTLRERGLTVAYVGGAEFAEELIAALERSALAGWRERYRRAEALILDDLGALGGMERGQEELFHLFEELRGKKRQLVFSADVPPHALPLPERLRSRLESGLVVELGPSEAPAPTRTEGDERSGQEPGEAAPGGDPARAGDRHGPAWIRNEEKVAWEWPDAEDWIVESLD